MSSSDEDVLRFIAASFPSVWALEVLLAEGFKRCHLWVLDDNRRARRFYERLGWRLNDQTRVVQYPPNPLDVSYTIDLETRVEP